MTGESGEIEHRCGPCMVLDHAACTRAKSGVFPFAGGFAIHCCCVPEAPDSASYAPSDRL